MQIRTSKVVLQTSLELHAYQEGREKESKNFSLNYLNTVSQPCGYCRETIFLHILAHFYISKGTSLSKKKEQKYHIQKHFYYCYNLLFNAML